MTEPKTERPTARRLERARSAGLVAKSHLLSSALLLAVAALVIYSSGHALVEGLAELMTRSLSEGHTVSAGELGWALSGGLAMAAEPLLPVFIALFVAALLATFIQIGPVFASRALRPDLGRLGLSAGLRRLFSTERAWMTLTAAMGAVAVVAVSVLVVRASLSDWVRLPTVPPTRGLAVIAASLLTWISWVLGLLILIGGLDFLVARRQRRRRLMMTRTESDRERREHEGEPVYRAERERLHRELLDFDFPRAVQSSTLLVVAPFASAAALFYDPNVVHVPEVLAKGRGHVAENLTDLAHQLAVPVVEDADLAARLQRVPVGSQVPEELYGPVALTIRDLRETRSD